MASFRARKVTDTLSAANTASSTILVQAGQGVALVVADTVAWTAGTIRVQARAKGGGTWGNIGWLLEKNSTGEEVQYADLRANSDMEIRLLTSSDFAGSAAYELISQAARLGD